MPPRRYIIPDIHGSARTFQRLLDVAGINNTDSIYLLGDYIDRGPRSREVLDIIIGMQEQGFAIFPLRGNHEEMLVTACRERSMFRLWLLNGGQATLDNFKVEDACDIPRRYLDFCAALPYYIILDDFLLVHGGLNCHIPDPFIDRETMLWGRSADCRPTLIGGRRLIGGHTPVTRDAIRASLKSNRFLLDNGCVYRDHPGLGSLTLLDLDTLYLSFQENID